MYILIDKNSDNETQKIITKVSSQIDERSFQEKTMNENGLKSWISIVNKHGF